MWLLFFCLEGHNYCLFSAQPLSESVAVCINRALVQQGLFQRFKNPAVRGKGLQQLIWLYLYQLNKNFPETTSWGKIAAKCSKGNADKISAGDCCFFHIRLLLT